MELTDVAEVELADVADLGLIVTRETRADIVVSLALKRAKHRLDVLFVECIQAADKGPGNVVAQVGHQHSGRGERSRPGRDDHLGDLEFTG